MEEPKSPEASSDRRRKVSIQVNVNPFLDSPDGVTVPSLEDSMKNITPEEDICVASIAPLVDGVLKLNKIDRKISEELSNSGASVSSDEGHTPVVNLSPHKNGEWEDPSEFKDSVDDDADENKIKRIKSTKEDHNKSTDIPNISQEMHDNIDVQEIQRTTEDLTNTSTSLGQTIEDNTLDLSRVASEDVFDTFDEPTYSPSSDQHEHNDPCHDEGIAKQKKPPARPPSPNIIIENLDIPEYVPLKKWGTSPRSSPKASPVTSRKCESPVLRRARMGQPSTAHKPRRKISSEARFGPPEEALEYNLPPRRKISSEARLGVHYRASTNSPPTQSPEDPKTKNRRVSFESKAYILGHPPTPLNDEYFYIPQIPPYHANKSRELSSQGISEVPLEHIQSNNLSPFNPNNMANKTQPDGIEHSEGACGYTRNVPTIVLSGDKATEGIETVSSGKESESLNSNGTQALCGYENPSFETDPKANEGSSPHRIEDDSRNIDTKTQTERFADENQNERNTISGSPDTPRNLIIYDADYTKKISSQSLPIGVGNGNNGTPHRLSWQSSDGCSTPKSILKTRKESMVSDDSILIDSKLSSKVRKDSIALFSDRNGDLESLRKQLSSPYKMFGRHSIKRMWENRGDFVEKHKLHLLVLLIFSITVAFVIVGLHFHSIHKENIVVSRRVFLEAKKRTLYLSDTMDRDRLSGRLGQNIPSWLLPSHCYPDYEDIHDETCLKWKKQAILEIAFTNEAGIHCYNISWKLISKDQPLDCFHLDGHAWYGPANASSHRMSITNEEFSFSSGNVKHYGSGTFTSALDFYWLSSSGAAIVLNSSLPVDISWNKKRKGQVCLSLPLESDDTGTGSVNTFSYHVCNGLDMVRTHTYIHTKFFPDLKVLPERSVLDKPHWSSLNSPNVIQTSQDSVMSLASSIKQYGLNCSTIEIDGKWEDNYGDLTFSQRFFTNKTILKEAILSAGCVMSLKVFPFFDYNSTNFREGLNRQYFIRAANSEVPALVKWQHGVGAMLDVSNPQARSWITRKIMKLVANYNIENFRFSYGTLAWIPNKPLFHLENSTPNKIKRLFTELMSTFKGSVVQGTSGSQHVTTFISVVTDQVKASDSVSCLNNVIPQALTIGFLGYPLLISDGFDVIAPTKESALLPSRDLFLRWMQLSSFFPAMRYTVKPWTYDDDIVGWSRNLTVFHQKVVVPKIYELQEEIQAGMPIIRPLWWLDDSDRATLKIEDQFVIGNSMLVAPVLCEQVRKRDIYFPKGVWKDGLRDTVIIGPQWLRDYAVGQYEIPYFERQKVVGKY